MNRETVNEIFELRIALECMAIELATLRVPLDKAEEVRDAYLQNEEHAVDSSELANKDRLVHDLARDYCGNRRLQRLLTSHLDLIRWAQNTVIIKSPGSYELALPEHLTIMNAVCERDGKGAAQAMRAHLENSRARLEAGLSAGNTTPMS